MTGTDDKGPKAGKDAQNAAREARRAAALRENLKRRKAQLRGRDRDAPAGGAAGEDEKD
ncbi:MAG: hypothetical protein WC670_15605 [Pseudolabrys sp.]|jgi:hypothetical protein